MAYEPGNRELPPDSPATVEELRALRRLLLAAAALAVTALVVAVIALVGNEQSSRAGASRSQVTELEERVDEQQDRLEEISSEREEVDERVAELERNQDTGDSARLEEGVERVEGETAKQQQRLDALVERVNRLAAR